MVKRINQRTALLLLVITGIGLACGPDLTVDPGDPGNLTGVWAGEVSYEKTKAIIVLWLE